MIMRALSLGVIAGAVFWVAAAAVLWRVWG